MSKTYIYTANITNTEPLLPYIRSINIPDVSTYRSAVARGDIQTLAAYYLDESSFDFTRDGDYVALGDDFEEVVMGNFRELEGTDTPPYEHDELVELYKQVKRAAEIKIEDALDEMEKDAAEEDDAQ